MDTRPTSVDLELLQATLLSIERRTRELNKSVCPAISFLLLFPTESLPPKVSEKVLTARELCAQAHATLAALAWETDAIRYQAHDRRILENRRDY